MRIVAVGNGETTVRADLDRPLDLSIPLQFETGAQPSAFGAPPATRQPWRNNGFLGDVSLGGSCNCDELHLIPHCNGTHTECVGHITRQRVPVHEIIRGDLQPAVLLSIATMTAGSCTEDSDPRPQPDDRLITAQSILAAWKQWSWPSVQVRALILRTLPNDAGKPLRRHDFSSPPPYLTRQAVELLVSRGIEHLLLDVPSADRLDDGGKLTAHRLFWSMPSGSTDLLAAARPQATITELIFAPDSIADGRYLLDLQVAPFAADAAPSRPILYPVIA